MAGDVAAIARSLADGAALEARDILGFTALHVAAAEGAADAVEALCSAGAAVDASSADGMTPLMLACRRAHLACVDWLCAGGANLAAESAGRRSVLDCVADSRSLPLLERLVGAGLPVPAGRRSGFFRLVLELTGHRVAFVAPGISRGSLGETAAVWAVDRPMRVPTHLLQPLAPAGFSERLFSPEHYEDFECRPETFPAGPGSRDPQQLGSALFATDWAHEVRASRLGPCEPIPGMGSTTPLGASVDSGLAALVVALLRVEGLDPRAVAAEPTPMGGGAWNEEAGARYEKRGLLPRHGHVLAALIADGLDLEAALDA
jgi:hypothetical protein